MTRARLSGAIGAALVFFLPGRYQGLEGQIARWSHVICIIHFFNLQRSAVLQLCVNMAPSLSSEGEKVFTPVSEAEDLFRLKREREGCFAREVAPPASFPEP